MTTPRLGHPPIKMRRRDKYDQVDQVGDFWWRFEANGGRVLIVVIPSHRTSTGFIRSSWIVERPNSQGAQWTWDGSEDEPTLTPSLHAVGEWHGWVRRGELVEA